MLSGHNNLEGVRQMTEQSAEKEVHSSGLLIARAIIIAVAGGIIWSAFFAFLYFFKFTEVAPKTFLLRPWLQAAWTDHWQGHLLSICLSGVISILPALLYYILFKKINSMWAGTGYGIFLWCIVFFLVNPLLDAAKPVAELSIDTTVTTLCIFILYGTFIGYSISYDYLDTKIDMEKSETAENRTLK